MQTHTNQPFLSPVGFALAGVMNALNRSPGAG